MDMTWITDRIAVGGGIWTDDKMQTVVREGVTHIIDMQIEFDDTPLAEPHAIALAGPPARTRRGRCNGSSCSRTEPRGEGTRT